MRIHLIAVGHRMPAWVKAGYDEFAQRLPAECRLQLSEIPLQARTATTDLARLQRQEGARMLAAIPTGAHVVALDVAGRPWSTEDLAGRLVRWLRDGRDVALLVGGPEGLHRDCLDGAHERWSLSALTFPHPLVRVIVAEQLYRAWSILNHHPYHRA